MEPTVDTKAMAEEIKKFLESKKFDLVDYSLAEISRYVEENNAKIISSTLSEDSMDKGKIKLTLKINQLDLKRIVATLERFNYRVIARYQETKQEDGERDKIDMLLRYLDI